MQFRSGKQIRKSVENFRSEEARENALPMNAGSLWRKRLCEIRLQARSVDFRSDVIVQFEPDKIFFGAVRKFSLVSPLDKERRS